MSNFILEQGPRFKSGQLVQRVGGEKDKEPKLYLLLTYRASNWFRAGFGFWTCLSPEGKFGELVDNPKYWVVVSP